MCGIAGGYGSPDRAAIECLVKGLLHRGPDGHAIYASDRVMLGHTRLAIIDPAGGQQPMGMGDTQICFNGEIYNYRQLRERYLRGVPLRTNSDTEVVLQLFRLFGPSCLRLLEGMFALAIAHDGELFLARDPLGIKPLYRGLREGTIYFASEIGALGQIAGEAQALPPGSYFSSQHGTQRYYEVGQSWLLPGTITTHAAALPAIRATLASAVHKRLLADVPVGVSLSGGLDSSIVALLACAEREQVKTFAVGLKGSADIEAARLVASYLGTQHIEYIYTEDDVEAALPDVIRHLESCDPALVRSAVPNYLLAWLASKHVKVILGGEGADELYGGYAYMAQLNDPEDLQGELMITLRELHRTNLQRTDRMFMAFGVEGRVPFLDLESVALALGLPARWKLTPPGQLSKKLLRSAFANDLPEPIVHRPKQKFSSGAGSALIFAQLAEQHVSDTDFAAERARLAADWNYQLPNKEALYYYRILREHLRDEWFLAEMGMSRSL